MSGLNYIDDSIEKKLLDLHTAYLAKVLSVNGKYAKIQPLGKTKEIGKTAVTKAPLSNVPIVDSAKNKITTKDITFVSKVSLNVSKSDGYVSSVSPNVTTKTEKVAVVKPIAAGDIVICVCADRDISEFKSGRNSTPSAGHHSLSDSVIVGIL